MEKWYMVLVLRGQTKKESCFKFIKDEFENLNKANIKWKRHYTQIISRNSLIAKDEIIANSKLFLTAILLFVQRQIKIYDCSSIIKDTFVASNTIFFQNEMKKCVAYHHMAWNTNLNLITNSGTAPKRNILSPLRNSASHPSKSLRIHHHSLALHWFFRLLQWHHPIEDH